jgi:hypothetical protein
MLYWVASDSFLLQKQQLYLQSAVVCCTLYKQNIPMEALSTAKLFYCIVHTQELTRAFGTLLLLLLLCATAVL